ncbi:unnamed protein product [marine sediment metagenome]|uniref:Uncharacterized protein n=1 Tax=marine sediment metagenome TaxID=412755 RepID=X0YTJ1_9ZZZZ
MVRISYKDGQSWESESNLFVNWDNLHEVYKDSQGQVRIQPNYLAPELITDTWDGKIFDVQHIRWEAWYLEFWIKESELQEISRIQSCKTIYVADLDNNLNHTVDMQTSEFLTFNEPERIADTSNWKISFIYRTNKTIINKASSILNTSNIATAFDDGSTVTNETFYTDFDILPTQEDTEADQFSNESSVNITGKAVSKNTSLVVFYLSRTDANTLKKEFERAQTITLNSTTVKENRIVEYEPIGEGLIKCIVNCLTESEVNYPLAV